MGSEGPETQANTFPQVIHSSGSKGMCCGCKRSFQTDFCKVTGDFPVLAGHKDWHACTSLITVTFLWQRPWTINNDAEEHSETCLLSHVRAEMAPWARIYLLTKRAHVTFVCGVLQTQAAAAPRVRCGPGGMTLQGPLLLSTLNAHITFTRKSLQNICSLHFFPSPSGD